MFRELSLQILSINCLLLLAAISSNGIKQTESKSSKLKSEKTPSTSRQFTSFEAYLSQGGKPMIHSVPSKPDEHHGLIASGHQASGRTIGYGSDYNYGGHNFRTSARKGDKNYLASRKIRGRGNQLSFDDFTDGGYSDVQQVYEPDYLTSYEYPQSSGYGNREQFTSVQTGLFTVPKMTRVIELRNPVIKLVKNRRSKFVKAGTPLSGNRISYKKIISFGSSKKNMEPARFKVFEPEVYVKDDTYTPSVIVNAINSQNSNIPFKNRKKGKKSRVIATTTLAPTTVSATDAALSANNSTSTGVTAALPTTVLTPESTLKPASIPTAVTLAPTTIPTPVLSADPTLESPVGVAQPSSISSPSGPSGSSQLEAPSESSSIPATSPETIPDSKASDPNIPVTTVAPTIDSSSRANTAPPITQLFPDSKTGASTEAPSTPTPTVTTTAPTESVQTTPLSSPTTSSPETTSPPSATLAPTTATPTSEPITPTTTTPESSTTTTTTSVPTTSSISASEPTTSSITTQEPTITPTTAQEPPTTSTATELDSTKVNAPTVSPTTISEPHIADESPIEEDKSRTTKTTTKLTKKDSKEFTLADDEDEEEESRVVVV